jgi:hypothetical protein
MTDHSSKDMQIIQDVKFCAGLPYVGARSLTEGERGVLLQESKDLMRTVVSRILLSIPFMLLPGGIAIWLSGISNPDPPSLGIQLFIVFIMFIICLPIPIIMVRAPLRQERTLKLEIEYDCIRRFEGKLNKDDWTDMAFEKLMEGDLLDKEDGATNRVELLGTVDAIFKVNEKRPHGWLDVEVTSAAAPEPDAANYTVPASWKPPESEIDLERMASLENCL